MILDRAQVAGGAADAPRKRIYLSPPVLAGFALVLLALVGIGLVSRRSITTLVETYDWVADTHDVLATLAALETEVVSGEAGKRAYLTTGLERHLARYEAGGSAAAESLARLRSLTADNPGQRQRLDRLQAAVRSRMANLHESIALHRRDPGAAAAQVALTDQGERLEGDLGATIAEMSGEERRLLARREGDARASARRALMVLLLGTAAAVAFLGLSAVVIDRQLRARQRAEDAVRASEATYRTVARNFPNGALILFDHDLRFQMADGTGLADTGLSPEGLVGRTMREALPAAICDELEPRYRGALEGEASTTEVFFAGRYRLVYLVPVRDEQGRITAGLVMSQDVTDRHLAEEEVGRLNAELARGVEELTAVNRELEAFSYSVSHDLRAPVRHINGFVDLLQRRAASGLDETARRHLDTIARAARQMGQLIDDLLSFARMGRTEMMRTCVRLAPLVAEVRTALAEETRGRDVAWSLDGLPDVKGDPAMLRVVATNLLSNALKYSRTREHAAIEVGWRPGEDGQAVVWVRDNGVGFDMQYVDKLFGVFQRLHAASEFEGTGIGLATVRRIVHRHGGRTWAEGGIDQGATIYITLPLYQESPA